MPNEPVTEAFTDEDVMFPVYCTTCRAHTPRSVSDANHGLCEACDTQASAPVAIATPAAQPLDPGIPKHQSKGSVKVGLIAGAAIAPIAAVAIYFQFFHLTPKAVAGEYLLTDMSGEALVSWVMARDMFGAPSLFVNLDGSVVSDPLFFTGKLSGNSFTAQAGGRVFEGKFVRRGGAITVLISGPKFSASGNKVDMPSGSTDSKYRASKAFAEIRFKAATINGVSELEAIADPKTVLRFMDLFGNANPELVRDLGYAMKEASMTPEVEKQYN